MWNTESIHNKEVKQECLLLPLLFHIMLKALANESRDWGKENCNVNNDIKLVLFSGM